MQLLSGGQDCSFRSFHATRDSQSRELSQGSLESIEAPCLKISDLKLSRSWILTVVNSVTEIGRTLLAVAKYSKAYTWSFKNKSLEPLILEPSGSNNDSSFAHMEFSISKRYQKGKRKRGNYARADLNSNDGYHDRIVSVALTTWELWCGRHGWGYIYRFSMQSGLQRGRYPVMVQRI